MPLQNRVDPFGNIHAVDARGLFTGNRGIIHDPATRTLLKKRWTTKAWIICSCSYKGISRDVMGYRPNGRAGWTELFFLDEVTALAAGHRPCFTCRRDAAKAYAAGFGKAFGVEKPTVKMMNERLHAERRASGGKEPSLSGSSSSGLFRGSAVISSKPGTPKPLKTRQPQQILGTNPRMTELSELPDGTMIHDGETAYALRHGNFLPWSFTGYGNPIAPSCLDTSSMNILTPATTIAVLSCGFTPVWHPSAG